MKRPLGFFLLAGFAAMLAALVVYSALKRREAEVQRANLQNVNLVVAAKDLSLGTKIDASSVKLARWSRDSMPPGSYTDPSAVIGTVVKNAFLENEPVVTSKLFLGEKTAGVMPLLIPAGMRAMSVAVDEVSDISGFVLPHSHVDILVAVAGGESGREKGAFSKVVLQNVEVLAVAQEIERKKDEPQVVRVVTVLLTLEEAERLALASREGNLRLAMRSFNDDKIVLTRGTDVGDMLHAYSLAPQIATISPQTKLGPVLKIKPPSIDVEILRNGKSAESLSFIDQTAENTATKTRARKLSKRERAAKSPIARANLPAWPDDDSAIDTPTHTAAAAPAPLPRASAHAAAPARAANAPAMASASAPGLSAFPDGAVMPKNPKVIDIP